jgi:hypothetical protein
MKRFVIWLFNINTDRFRLDVGRVIEIDGYEFVIDSFDAHKSYPNLEEITIRFQSLERFKERKVA